MVMSQCLFLLFVAVTAPIAWRATFAGEQRPVTTS
jgi:hypothetical protein